MLTLRPLVLAAALAAPVQLAALDAGEKVDDVQVPTLDGRSASLIQAGVVNVLVFARPGHGHCLDTLGELARRAGKLPRARWAVVVPGDSILGEARGLLAGVGNTLPVLLDPADLAYGRLGLKLHPTVVVVDGQGRLAAVEAFREIGYIDRLEARVRFTLGEITAAQLAEVVEPPRSETHSGPGMAQSGLQFARKLVELGRLDLALAAVETSLATAPSGRGHLLRGEILARQGKCAEAGRALELAVRLEPGNAEAAAERRRCAQGSGAAQ